MPTRLARTHRFPRLALAAALVTTLVAAPAQGQSGLPGLEDASLPGRGKLRFRAINSWIRYDRRFVGDSTVPLATGFAAESLGVAELPGLGPVQVALRTLTGDPGTRLTLGRLAAVANTRIVVTPLSLEYGITRRLAIGVLVPFVQPRTRVRAQLNGDTLALRNANVGVNPGDYTASSAIADAFATAASDLRALVQQCQADPSGAGCGPVNANPQGASQLATQGQSFADAVSTVYGTGGDNPGAPVVPLAGSTIVTAINQNVAALNQAYEQYLGRTVTTATLGGATVPGANALLQAVLRDPRYVGVDSLGTRELLWVGDIEVGASLQLVDQLSDSVARARGGLLMRAAVRGLVRLPTGKTARGTMPFESGTGTGQTGIEGRAALDLANGRVGLSLLGQYTLHLGSARVFAAASPLGGAFPLAPRLPYERQLGNIIQVDATPRFALTSYFTLNGYYSMQMRGDDQYLGVAPEDGAVVDPIPGAFVSSNVTVPGATVQRVGLGFSYSLTGTRGEKRSAIPIDMRYAHLETIAASGGPAVKAFYDQVQIRIYYPLLRGR